MKLNVLASSMFSLENKPFRIEEICLCSGHPSLNCVIIALLDKNKICVIQHL